MYTGYNTIFETISKTKNHPVKNSVKSAQGTMLFDKEGAILYITQSKIPLMVPGQNSIFQEREILKIAS